MNRYYISTPLGRLRGAIGQFYPVIRCYRGDTPEEAIAAFREDIESNAPPVAELANTPQMKPRTTYRDRDGKEVCIAGLCRYQIDGEEVWWSIQGNHYTASGLFVHSRRKEGTAAGDFVLESYVRLDDWRNIATEDISPAARKWWDGVEV